VAARSQSAHPARLRAHVERFPIFVAKPLPAVTLVLLNVGAALKLPARKDTLALLFGYYDFVLSAIGVSWPFDPTRASPEASSGTLAAWIST
jgi:hypothetical protein